MTGSSAKKAMPDPQNNGASGAPGDPGYDDAYAGHLPEHAVDPDAAGEGWEPHETNDAAPWDNRPSDAAGDGAPPARPAGPGIAARAMGARRDTSYLDRLNPEQRRAVETLDGPVLVLAGAGTGKTSVLTTRIAHLLATGRARPYDILAVTFTNKAAREMKTRVGHLIGGVVEGMQWLGTFHSIGARMLRRHAELVDLKSDFTILDTDDQIRLMKQLIQAAGIDEKRWPARQLAGWIDSWKNKGLTPDKVPVADAHAFADGRGVKLYAAYQARLKVLNAADFGDLVLEPLRILQAHPDVLADYHRRFRYMLVDEYQDTNVAQYLWLRLLAQGHRNICCVGDDDQSIYGWRGAEVDNILRFEKDFPGATVIRLERNYRSTAHILGAASHLIAHNESRLGKTLFTDAADPDADKVSVASSWDSEEEARAVGEEIEQLQRQGHVLNEVAILVRASFQMRAFEDRFVTLGLNYRVIGGPRFYERQEIRDALAYFRVVVQPADDLAFERIVNTPRRGIGDTTVRLLHARARAESIPLTEAAAEMAETDEINARARTSLRQLLAQFDRWREQLAALPHTELAEIILEESGYTEMWQADRSADAPGRLENLKELVRSMDEFETMGGFLEHVSLVMDADAEGSNDAVSIMTLHSAKGLEFDTVFLPGWEEGLFPSQRTLDESGRAGLEEERRLAYVGLTRARKRAYVRFASNRRMHGLWQTSIPSRFLDELPEHHVDVVEETSSYGGYGMNSYGASRFDLRDPFQNTYDTPGWQRAQKNKGRGGSDEASMGGYGTFSGPKSTSKMIEGELVAKSVIGGTSEYSKGERVFHQKFGYGQIASIDGNKLTIDFDKAGRKRVLDNFVERH
ncbi:UvrD-helicase domain-containing protein [Bauldia sp.]|uniref:ATP-dependent helicase n=1 Tax=Bauldia sp. TaxID=2575872 RepID=UPI003BAC9462